MDWLFVAISCSQCVADDFGSTCSVVDRTRDAARRFSSWVAVRVLPVAWPVAAGWSKPTKLMTIRVSSMKQHKLSKQDDVPIAGQSALNHHCFSDCYQHGLGHVQPTCQWRLVIKFESTLCWSDHALGRERILWLFSDFF